MAAHVPEWALEQARKCFRRTANDRFVFFKSTIPIDETLFLLDDTKSFYHLLLLVQSWLLVNWVPYDNDLKLLLFRDVSSAVKFAHT